MARTSVFAATKKVIRDGSTRDTRTVVLFAALTTTLLYMGVFDPVAPPPFDTTESDAFLPAIGQAAPDPAATSNDPLHSDPEADPLESDLDEDDGTPSALPFSTAGPGHPTSLAFPGPQAPLAAIPTVLEFTARPPRPIVPFGATYNGEPVPSDAVVDPASVLPGGLQPAWVNVGTEDPGTTDAFDLVDEFDALTDWQIFEQLVPGSSGCYQQNLASFDNRVLEGSSDPVLELRANDEGRSHSNHPILGRRLEFEPMSGLYRLSVDARIPEEHGADLQTGPEFSLQNTALGVDGAHLTQTFGVQYVAVPGLEKWNLWARFGDEVGWRAVHDEPLLPGEWYTISIVYDTATGEYHELTVQGATGFTVLFDGVESMWQDKGFHENAVWLTLEVENLWTCNEPRPVTAVVQYDTMAHERIG